MFLTLDNSIDRLMSGEIDLSPFQSVMNKEKICGKFASHLHSRFAQEKTGEMGMTTVISE